MLIHPWDRGTDAEALEFVRAIEFGLLVAPGRRDVPVLVPTQFLLADDATVLLHLARPNPVFPALAERPTAVLSVVGEWAYVPSGWKAIGAEDPRLGIPTTYYSAVHLTCDVTVVDDPDGKLEILRRQLGRLEPDYDDALLEHHRRQLAGIRGIRLGLRAIEAKFKVGGNVDAEHRLAVADRLAARRAPGDAAARARLLRHLPPDGSTPGAGGGGGALPVG